MERIPPGTWAKLNNNSLVDTLKSQGQDSSFWARSQLASEAGIQWYRWTADQNMQLLNRIRQSAGAPSNPWTQNEISAWAWLDVNNIPRAQQESAKLEISRQNSTYWVDPVMDSALTSTYVNPEDKVRETIVDKIWMETWLYADIQNIDEQVMNMQAMLTMPNDDIFWNPNLSFEEKLAASQARENITFNQISNLRRIQQAKQSEIRTLSEAEQRKAQAQEAERRSAMEYMKMLQDERKLTLDEQKFQFDMGYKEAEFGLKAGTADLAREKLQLEQSKFMAGSGKSTPLLTGDFSSLNVWEKYGNWNVTQTYGTKSILNMDNTKLVNWVEGTPGIDLAWALWDPIRSFTGGEIVKVISGQSNVSVSEVNAWRARASFWNMVIVKDQQGNMHYYSHLNDVWQFEPGQVIQEWQMIGTMGNSWSSTKVHLDYRVQSQRWWEDPRTFMTKESPNEITNIDTYVSMRNSTWGGNVISKVKPAYASSIIESDIGKFELSGDELKKLQNMPGANIDTKVITKYKMEELSTKRFQSLEGKDFVSYLDTLMTNTSDEALQKFILQSAIYSGKVEWDLWTPGLFRDGAGYNVLQKYFDNPKQVMEELRANLIKMGYTPEPQQASTQTSQARWLGKIVSFGSDMLR